MRKAGWGTGVQILLVASWSKAYLAQSVHKTQTENIFMSSIQLTITYPTINQEDDSVSDEKWAGLAEVWQQKQDSLQVMMTEKKIC